jgi:adenylate cyclase
MDLALIIVILVTLVLAYAVVKLHNLYKDTDNVIWIVMLSLALLIATDTWISFYGQNVKAFFDKYRFLFTFIPLVVFLVYTLIDRRRRKEAKEKEIVKQAFRQYVTPALLDEILKDPSKLKLGGQKRTTTIMFSDIRGFTTISEALSPEELVQFLNIYLTQMTDIILEKHGTVDKYIGDAIMAFWNAPLDEPSHTMLACEAALANIEALRKLHLPYSWAEKRLAAPRIGIGINTGEVVVGNVGSQQRFDYTALGDHVNLASRLEGLTKFYGVDIIVSDGVHALVKDKLFMRELDKVAVMGRKMPVTIYELVKKPTGKEDVEFFNVWQQGIAKYRERDFVGAQRFFGKCNELRPMDKAAQIYLERCIHYRKHPPAKDWDGAFHATEK